MENGKLLILGKLGVVEQINQKMVIEKADLVKL